MYQMLPSLSSVRPCGPDFGVFSGNSFIAPVLGSSRPSTLAHMPGPPDDAVGGGERIVRPRAERGHDPLFDRDRARRRAPPPARRPASSESGSRDRRAPGGFTAGGRAIMLLVSASHPSWLLPRELVMLVSGWHPAHIDWTCSLPGRPAGQPDSRPAPGLEAAPAWRHDDGGSRHERQEHDVRVFVLVCIEGLLQRGDGNARAAEAPHCTVQSGRLTRGGSRGTRDEWPTLKHVALPLIARRPVPASTQPAEACILCVVKLSETHG